MRLMRGLVRLKNHVIPIVKMIAMEQPEIMKLYSVFLQDFDVEEENRVWDGKSSDFRRFWNDKVLNDAVRELGQQEIDEIVRMLDRNASGNRPENPAVAKAMIRQDNWRKMFIEMKKDAKTKDLLNKIFNEDDDGKLIDLIDELNKVNSSKNGLTGLQGNALNALLFAYAPTKHVSVISLKDRRSVIEHFNFQNGPDFHSDSWGRQIVVSNNAIINGFKNLGITSNPRIISWFLYRNLKSYWKPDGESVSVSREQTAASIDSVPRQVISQDATLFSMEKHLEDFLIANWDKTDFAKKYELINDEHGELVSQQYPTGVGPVDILVRDRRSGQYVIIELKRNQTSDDTVGQLLRYMGWLEENLTKGALTKGIIIAAEPDKRLHYALRKIPDAELYLYQVTFTLTKAEGTDQHP